MAKLTEQQKARILAGTLGRVVLARELGIKESEARKMIELVKAEAEREAKQKTGGVTEAMRQEIVAGKLGRVALSKKLGIKEHEARKIIEAIRSEKPKTADVQKPVAKVAPVAPKAEVEKKEDHLGARFRETDKRADERDAKIVELYSTGEYKSQKTVAALVGCSESTVGEVLKRAGVKARRPGSPAAKVEPKVEAPKELKWFASTKFINIMADGKTFTADSSHESFRKALDLCIAGDVLKALGLINVAKGVSSYAGTNIEIKNDTVYFKGMEVGNSVVERIIQSMHEGKPFEKWVRFLEKLLANPNKRVVGELFKFLEAKDIVVNDKGDVVAYRRVRNDYKDFHSGTVLYKVGTEVKMDRSKCDESSATCSRGLHLCSKGYLPHFHGGSGKILECTVSPTDIVSIPADYGSSKMRTCKMFVLREMTEAQVKALIGNKN
ncbi:membrane integrity protector [Aeromonas phage Ah1]|uniref:Membrane integrity protector n=1 Tax=Aeromonas phage Ah1 TaxID=2053701 RepID=A0A2H4YFE7_9CAUD|nr:RIIB lysis inhibitor [Aeromonas phage Ah1]AUE22873.1 membrane integrity protector [Aeromonas phage Ah1]UYD60072.1 hypothetical protein OPFAMLBM_00051 [Aeromonas phage avDM12-TAAL]